MSKGNGMHRRLLAGIGCAAALSVIGIAPALAGTPGKVSPHEFGNVHQWDEKGHVEIVWDRSGHRIAAWTDDEGHRFIRKAYPSSVPGDYVLATFLRYTLEPPDSSDPSHVTALYSKSWCLSDNTCSDTPPA